MFEYMTVQDAAKLWGISVRRVQKLCEENRIDGIVRLPRASVSYTHLTLPTT